MPTIEQNLSAWGGAYAWPQAGDEWSEPWGGTDLMWLTSILPRIRGFVPTGTILEIAPGYGRCTQFLKELCERLVGVDLGQKCVAACRERFADSRAEFHVNDGKSFPMLGSESVDFAFSFDSLVHVEADTLEAYAFELARVLKHDGVGFIHHSNIGDCALAMKLARAVPERVGKLEPRSGLARRGFIVDTGHWRAESVHARKVAVIFSRAGLHCITQELISWRNGRFLIDCFSTFTRPGSRWDHETRVIRNPGFSAEQKRAKKIAEAYPLPS